MLKILQYGNPNLEKPSEKVEVIKDPKVLKLIEDMLEVLDREQDHSAGLSAPQVGSNLRIVICRRMDIEESIVKKNEEQSIKKKVAPIWEIMINPEIIYKSPEFSSKWEGCLSVNQGEIFAQVKRPKLVKIKYSSIDGTELELTADEYFSHVVQHEIDHLNGDLFLKYVSDPSQFFTAEEIENL